MKIEEILTASELARIETVRDHYSKRFFLRNAIVGAIEQREDYTLKSQVRNELYDAIRMAGFNIGDFDVHDTHILPDGRALDAPKFDGEWVRIAHDLEGWQHLICLIYHVDTGEVTAEYVQFRKLDPTCLLICNGEFDELETDKYAHRFSACDELMAATYEDLHDALEAFRELLKVN